MDATQFNSRVDKESTPSCWLWRGKPLWDGYGQIKVKGKTYRAHRLSYVLFKGDIPKGMCVLHTCDNRLCVNPKHLWVGTKKQNTQDMITKGRQRNPLGSSRPNAKLSDCDVIKIRNLSRNGVKRKDLMLSFGVGKTTIHNIINGLKWKHLL